MKVQRERSVRNLIYIVLIVIILTTGCKKEKTEEATELSLAEGSLTATENVEKPDLSESEKKGTVFVYVCGAVHAPGVYELSGTSRVYEAIGAAGGVTEGAAGEYLNQAKVVTDGEQIYIPTKEEMATGVVDGVKPKVTGADSQTGGKININTATKEELKTLPGIGDAKADSILTHRETVGAFSQVEDLMQIEGIKEGVFNKIKDQITV